MRTIRVYKPAECSHDMFEAFCALVLKGGEVLAEGLANRVKNAAFLAFAQEGEAIVGVAALKNPNGGYRAEVFRKAQGGIAVDFRYELGWVYVVQTARQQGVSMSLVEELFEHGKAGVYATSRAGNQAMHRTLRRAGFEVSGVPYASREHHGEEILLFLRPHGP